jgi:hypothetical protein
MRSMTGDASSGIAAGRPGQRSCSLDRVSNARCLLRVVTKDGWQASNGLDETSRAMRRREVHARSRSTRCRT